MFPASLCTCTVPTLSLACLRVPSQTMPYELRALEAALLEVVRILEREVAALEGMTHPGAALVGWAAG